MQIETSSRSTCRKRGHLFLPELAGRRSGADRWGAETGRIVVPDKLGECIAIWPPPKGFDSLKIVSMGPAADITLERIRRVGGAIAAAMSAPAGKFATVDMGEVVACGVEGAVTAMCEGIELGSFQFNRHKSGREKSDDPRVTLVFDSVSRSNAAEVKAAGIIASATNYARSLAHEPANVINPVTLADEARSLAKSAGLKCAVLDERDMKRLKMGAILAVGQASASPPRMIVLEYGDARRGKPVALVGKAVTFDTGGYSLKDKDGIVGMKYDKCGGMAVLGVMQAVSRMQLKTPVVGVIAAAENMIAGNAYRPNDIIRSMAGKTIEIISTDAEGRLVLADALTHVQKQYKPRAIIDLATLTGGVVVALGKVLAGLFTNDDGLRDQLLASGERTHERLWPLPIHDDYFDLIKGDDCDFKNSANREAHATVGAVFLKQFVNEKMPWAHLDIAGVAHIDKPGPYCRKGATGFGVRLLCDYLRGLE